MGFEVPEAAEVVYRFNFFAGCGVSAGVYWALCKVWPVEATSECWMEVGDLDGDGEEVVGVGVAYGEVNEGSDHESVYDEVRDRGKGVLSDCGSVIVGLEGKKNLEV